MISSFEKKTYVIMGVTNKKSVAAFVTETLREQKATIILTVQDASVKANVEKLFPQLPIFICDVTKRKDLEELKEFLKPYAPLAGLLHSVAFAPFRPEVMNFHDIPPQDFLLGAHVSCFSLVEICAVLKPLFHSEASVVTVSVSNAKIAAYGLLGPIKSALDTLVGHLAKSFSKETQMRFNAVCSGPLKTSASAGIPDFLDYYLFAEQLTLRKKALKTQEVANTICFLLSDASSGINGQRLIVDAGLDCNGFDETVVKATLKQLYPT